MGKLMKLSDAAERLGVDRQTIENWAARGVLHIKKDSKPHYVDSELIEQIADFGSDVAASLKALQTIKEDYEHQAADIRKAKSEMMKEWNDVNDIRRYKNFCVESSIRTDFFTSVLTLFVYSGDLSQREASILSSLLHGESMDDIAQRFGLIRESIRQIALKAIRKANTLSSIKERFMSLDELQTTVQSQKIVINDLRSKLKIQEEQDALAKQLSDEAVRNKFIENDALCTLLSRRLIDCDITVRSLNCVKSIDIETIGDLVKHSKLDLLKCRNFGKKSLTELSDFVDSLGLSFGMDVDKIYCERIEYQMALHNDET